MAEQKPMQRVLLVPGWEDVKRGQIFHAIHETEAKDAGGDKAQVSPIRADVEN